MRWPSPMDLHMVPTLLRGNRLLATLCVIAVAGSLPAAEPGSRGEPWPRHVIDDSSRGADGVRLADVNGDKLPDIVTGWEEGGVTRVYVHPGHDAAKAPWPAVTVGKTSNVEDAVFVDLDADGHMDVVSSCEGGTRTMFVHWAPADPGDYLDPKAWTTEPIPATQGRMMWMFCLPLDIDGRGGVDLVAAGKGPGCQVGWLQSPGDPRALDRWKWHPISPAGWVMSVRAEDLDGDGDQDVLITDRKGPARGCRWLENPGAGAAASGPWTNHWIGGQDHEVMFLTVADLDADGTQDILAATRDNGILWFRRSADGPDQWSETAIPLPENTGTGKGVAVGDLDRDGRPDVVFSCEHATGDKSGVMWLSQPSANAPTWSPHEISGPIGIKFDRLELLDLDGDGDLDVLACEESHPVENRRHGLGVFWYEKAAK